MSEATFEIEKSVSTYSTGAKTCMYALTGHGVMLEGESLDLDDLRALAEFLNRYLAEEQSKNS